MIGRDRPPLKRCLRALVSGQLANALVPIRAGEVLSLALLKVEGGALVPSGAALAAAKALDAVVLAVLAVAVLGATVGDRARLVFVSAALILIAGVVVALLRPSWRQRLASLPGAKKLQLPALLEMAGCLRSLRSLLVVVGTSATVWLAGSAANGLVLLAAGVALDFRLVAGMLVAGYVVGVVPAPPGRIGVFEAGMVAVLTSSGVSLGQAIAASVMLHVCQLCELGLLLGLSMLPLRWPLWFLRASTAQNVS